jgi:nucleoside-diphosphate-sugar epimerase
VATLYIDNLLDALLSASRAPDAACNAYYATDSEPLDANEFIGMLCKSVGLPPPRKGYFPLAYAAAWARERFELPGPWTAEVARRARSSLFDIARAVKDLDYEPRVSVEEGMRRLKQWAEQVGGPNAIAAMARQPSSLVRIEAEARQAARSASAPDTNNDES